MPEPIWNKFLTERDKAVFAASGYGARGGFGKRPALLVIDVNYAFCGDKPEPILESIKRWRNSCGEESWPAVAAIKSLRDKAHETGIPVLYTTGVQRSDNWDAGSWSWKNGRSGEDKHAPATNIDGNRIVDEIAPTRKTSSSTNKSRQVSSAPTWPAICNCSAVTASSLQARQRRAVCVLPC